MSIFKYIIIVFVGLVALGAFISKNEGPLPARNENKQTSVGDALELMYRNYHQKTSRTEFESLLKINFVKYNIAWTAKNLLETGRLYHSVITPGKSTEEDILLCTSMLPSGTNSDIDNALILCGAGLMQ